MNMITKWNRPDNMFPVTLRGMDDLIHAFFGQFGTEFSPEWMHDHDGGPQLELKTTPETVIARLPLPGCKSENIEVEVLGDCLTVRATQNKQNNEDKKGRYLRQERSTEEYEESVSLPVAVYGSKTTAKYVDGVLTITLPRVQAEKPSSHIIKVN